VEKFIGIAAENKVFIPELTEAEDSWRISSTLDVTYNVKIHDNFFETSDLEVRLNKENSSPVTRSVCGLEELESYWESSVTHVLRKFIV
jgi:hypothetical protein